MIKREANHFLAQSSDSLINHPAEILTNNNTSYYDTNISSHHHFYDDENNELTDINFSDVEVVKIPHAPKGKKIKNIEVIISLQKH